MKKLTNFAKKIMAIVATLALAVVSTINANAAQQTIQLGNAPYTERYIGSIRFHIKQTTDHTLLYCLDMHRAVAQNITAHLVSPSRYIDGGIVYILKNGYPKKSITGNNEMDYYITQTAIWWYLDDTTGSQNLGKEFKETGADPYNLRPKVIKLKNAGIANRNYSHGISTLKFDMETSDLNMTQSGNYFISKSIKVTGSSAYKTFSLLLEGAPTGTIIEYNGNETTSNPVELPIGTSFKIKVPTKQVDSDLSIKVKATTKSITQVDAYEYQPDDSNMQPVALFAEKIQSGSASLLLKIATSSVTITKVDAGTNKPLAGAVLVVKNSNGVELYRWTSTTSAKVIKNLANGTYTVEEISAPEGYKLNKTPVSFTISSKNRHVKVTFKNEAEKVAVTITKIDKSTNKPLAGAVLVIKDKNGAVVHKFTSKTTPEVITSLKKGTYTVEEISAPKGYIKSNKVVKFTIDSNHLTHQIEFENEPTGVSIIKVDAATNKPLAGAVLVVKNSKGIEVARWTSTTTAHIIKRLPLGTYTVEEVKAPEGYKLNTTPIKFTVSDNNSKNEVKVKNEAEKIVVQITKVDQETQNPLAGAVLVIKDKNGNEVYRFTSSTSSEVITTLGKGTYTVEEISAPEGYIKSDKKVTFTIDSNHLSHQIIFENAKETEVPDTASSASILLMILGLAIVGYGLCFISENKQTA